MHMEVGLVKEKKKNVSQPCVEIRDSKDGSLNF